ncbi:MAG: hypothetical protein ABSH45_07340 [Bryobacteraceae bacterium]|jgi:hypothetical protein
MKTKLMALMLLVGSAAFAGPRFFVGARLGFPAPVVAYNYGPPVVAYASPYGAPVYGPAYGPAYVAPYPGAGYSWTAGFYGPGRAWHAGYWGRPYGGAVYGGARFAGGGRYYRGYGRR